MLPRVSAQSPIAANAPSVRLHGGELPDEETLVRRIASGDEAAFECLFWTYYDSLCHFTLTYVRVPEVAEDVVQGLMAQLWAQRRTWNPRAGVRAYLFSACRNAAIDVMRHRAVEHRFLTAERVGEAIPGWGSSPPSPADAAVANDLSKQLHVALATLPEKRRAVVLLRWQQQLGPSEIAAVLGISVKGVEAHLSRAFAALRKLTYLRA